MIEKFYTYHISSYVATIGGGISTAQIVQTLRILYSGGAYVDKRILELITCGEGTSRFMHCHRHRLMEKSEKTSARDIHDSIRRVGMRKPDDITYEVGLRWFLTHTTGHISPARPIKVAVLPPEPLLIDKKPQVLAISAGTDGPRLNLCDVNLEDDSVWPGWDFLTASEITPSPYNH
jgi:hypothetical protein